MKLPTWFRPIAATRGAVLLCAGALALSAATPRAENPAKSKAPKTAVAKSAASDLPAVPAEPSPASRALPTPVPAKAAPEAPDPNAADPPDAGAAASGVDAMSVAELAQSAGARAEAELGIPTAPLQLQDAILRALENNTALAVARLSPPIAESQIMTARGAFDAVLSGGANYSRTADQIFLDRRDARLNRVSRARIELDKPFATGTTVGISGTIDRNHAADSDPNYFTTLSLNARQALLRGLNPKANLANIRQAENDYKGSLYRLESDAINTLAAVESTYWDLALAYELLGAQRLSLDLAERQLERTRAFVEVGGMSPLEITTAEAEVATRQRDYIDAKNNLQITAIQLSRLIEADLGDAGPAALPKPSTEAQLSIEPMPAAEAVRLALANRPDLAQAHLDLENGNLRVIQTRDGLLPRLDLVGSYGLTGSGANPDPAFENLRTGDFDRYSIGVEFEAPLPNRRARGADRAARYSRDQLERSISNLRQTITADTLEARITLVNQLAGVDAARVALRLNEEKLTNEEEKWKNGLSTTLDVFQAQRDLVAARNQLLIRIANALKTEITLYVRQGILLQVRGLSAEGGTKLDATPAPAPARGAGPAGASAAAGGPPASR